MNQSGSSTAQTQRQPVTLVSFASTTQVRMDMVVPATVSQILPQVPPVQVPLSQITSVASMANMAASLISQQSGTSATTQPQQQTDVQYKKCGKKNHSTTCCQKKVTCKECKGKDHSTKFCTTCSQQELKCTFCGKSKHSTENCKARKKTEKKLKKSQEDTYDCLNHHINYVIGSTTLVTGPTSTESSASTIDPGDNAASTITNS